MNTKKTARVHAFDIEYDTDGVSVQWLRNEGANLPSEMWLDVETDEITEGNSSEIAEAISDVTGFCVLTFNFHAFACN
jgi:hypothetical protein